MFKSPHIAPPLLLSLLLIAAADPAAAAEDPNSRWHEPRDRQVDLTHMDLAVVLNFNDQTLTGTVTFAGKVLHDGAILLLHGHELNLKAAHWLADGAERPATWRSDGDELRFTPPVAKKDATFLLRIRYGARPQQGMYFQGPDGDDPKRPQHVWTQGETQEARHWLPCPDDPDERFTWTVTADVPAAMVVLSNGEPTVDKVSGGRRIKGHSLDRPFPIYLLSLVVGPFREVIHPHPKIRFSTWGFAHDEARLRHSGKGLPVMADLFARFTGQRYPMARYGQVFVDEFGWGGMENVTLTTLALRRLGTARTDRDRTSEGLVAHELAHQWFGDLLTCRTWADIWLNEGFATYFAGLYAEQTHGRDRLDEYMAWSRPVLAESPNARDHAVVRDKYVSAGQLFDDLAYGKGGWVLHMLRRRFGDEAFFAGIAGFVRAHQYGSVETVDFQRAMEGATGRSLRGFFRRWLHQPGVPRLRVQTRYDRRSRLLRVQLEQRQPVDAARPLFVLPVQIRIRKSRSDVGQTHVFVLDQKKGEFTLPLSLRPDLVEIDPDMALLAGWDMNAGVDMLANLARHGSTADVRLRAVRSLRKHLSSDRGVDALLDVLGQDKARHVRLAAAKVLGRAPRKAARATLLKALKTDPEARVRARAALSLGELHDAAAWTELTRAARGGFSPGVQSAALRALATIDRQRARPTLVAAMGWPSYGHQVALAAMNQLGLLADGRDLDRLWQATSPGRAQHLRRGAVAALAIYGVRNEAARLNIRGHLEGLLQSDNRKMRDAAAQALSALGDPAARPAMLAAADREPNARRALRLRKAAEALTGKTPAARRIKALEEAVAELQRGAHHDNKGDHHGGHKAGDRERGDSSKDRGDRGAAEDAAPGKGSKTGKGARKASVRRGGD